MEVCSENQFFCPILSTLISFFLFFFQSLMGAVKEAFIKSFKHKMDFDISTPHGFLAFMNKKFNQSPNPAERNIVFPANRG